MPELLQIYKCEVCGNIVEMLHAGAGELVCCGQPMKLFVENTVDAAKEKHVPVKEASAGGLTVKVGSVAHPMEEKHYIEWIEIVADGKTYRQVAEARTSSGSSVPGSRRMDCARVLQPSRFVEIVILSRV